MVSPILRKLTISSLTLLILSFAAASARADTVIAGGSLLLSQQQANQLGSWAGGGVQLNKIFNHQNGIDSKTATDFQAATHAQGATFSLLSVTLSDGRTLLIGGFDPVSWESNAGYHVNATDTGRTAFLFNFTDGGTYRQDQKLLGDASCSYCGLYQTYNQPGYGPTFGGGHDLWTDPFLNDGYAYNWSYGTSFVQNNILNINQGLTQYRINSIEVFSIQAVATPEPASMLLLGTGLVGVAAALRKKRRPKLDQ